MLTVPGLNLPPLGGQPNEHPLRFVSLTDRADSLNSRIVFKQQVIRFFRTALDSGMKG